MNNQTEMNWIDRIKVTSELDSEHQQIRDASSAIILARTGG
jgi:hypothetical protein